MTTPSRRRANLHAFTGLRRQGRRLKRALRTRRRKTLAQRTLAQMRRAMKRLARLGRSYTPSASTKRPGKQWTHNWQRKALRARGVRRSPWSKGRSPYVVDRLRGIA